MKLSEAIAAVPKSVLAIGKGDDRRPNWPGIFADAVARLLGARGVKFQEATLLAIAEHVNISSFQRSAAQAAADHINGVVKEKKAAAPKVPMKKGKRGADPITGLTKGEAKKEAAAAKKTAKEEAALEKELAKAGKKSAKKAAPKAPKKAAKESKAAAIVKEAKEEIAKAKPKKTKPAPAPAAEVDPITGI